jgi:hypothetical protein
MLGNSAPQPQGEKLVCVVQESVLEKFNQLQYEPTGNNYSASNTRTISTHPTTSSGGVVHPESSVLDSSDLIQRYQPDNPFFLFRYREQMLSLLLWG